MTSESLSRGERPKYRPGELPEADLRILAHVDQGLEDATELYNWYLWSEENNTLQRTPVVRQLGTTDRNYAFLSEAPLTRGLLPVIGLVQDLFYDRPKAASAYEHTAAEWYRAQIQEFMMRYFMRITTTKEFRRSVEGRRRRAEEATLPLDDYQGWGYYQLFYKLRGSGKIGKFRPDERFKIIDLREIGKKYEWVVLKIRFFNLIFRGALFGADGPRLEVPVTLQNYVVISPKFVVNRKNPRPGVLGEYGFGTPVVPVPDPDSVLAYGPSGLSEAFQFIIFRVLTSGEVRVRLTLVANRPTRIIQFDPVEWGFNMADLMSFGMASRLLAPAKALLKRVPLPEFSPLFFLAGIANSITGDMAEYQFCVSRRQIYKAVMTAHFFDLYQLIQQTFPTWDSVPDWLDEKNLPSWALEGAQPHRFNQDLAGGRGD